MGAIFAPPLGQFQPGMNGSDFLQKTADDYFLSPATSHAFTSTVRLPGGP
jgi:hypothetical protein